MLSSNVLKAIQLASFGAGCASATAASAEPPPKPTLTAQASEPAMEMSPKVREKIAIIAARDDTRHDTQAETLARAHAHAPDHGHGSARKAPDARIAAIRALADMMDETAVGPLAFILENSESDVFRAEITVALKKLNAGAVLAKAAESASPDARRQALRLLRVVCDRASQMSASAMQKGLEDPDPTVRAAAASAIGRCGEPTDVPALARRLTDDNDEVRSAVAQALGNFDDARARAALEAASQNETDAFVQVFIRGSLKRLSSKPTKTKSEAR